MPIQYHWRSTGITGIMCAVDSLALSSKASTCREAFVFLGSVVELAGLEPATSKVDNLALYH